MPNSERHNLFWVVPHWFLLPVCSVLAQSVSHLTLLDIPGIGNSGVCIAYLLDRLSLLFRLLDIWGRWSWGSDLL